MGFGDSPGGTPDRIGGLWILRRYGWVTVNGDPSTGQRLSMKDSHKGIFLSSPLALNLTQGRNTITIGGQSNGNGTKAADVDRIIVYPLEKKASNGSSGANGTIGNGATPTGAPAEFTAGAAGMKVGSGLMGAVGILVMCLLI